MTGAVAAGARLGPYEILAPLGAGGMGETARTTRRSIATSRWFKVSMDPGDFVARDYDISLDRRRS